METRRHRGRHEPTPLGALLMDTQFLRRAVADSPEESDSLDEEPPGWRAVLLARWQWLKARLLRS